MEEFYTKLYTEGCLPPKEQREYIQRKNHIKLSKHQQGILNQPYSMNEVSEAFIKHKMRKSPESDGIPAEYYREFEDVLLISF